MIRRRSLICFDTLLEVGIDVRLEENEIPGHIVIHLDVGGDAAVQQAGYLDQVEISEEVDQVEISDVK